MQDTCNEIRRDSPNEIVDTAGSLDGLGKNVVSPRIIV